MGSRIRDNPSKVFECFVEVAVSNGTSPCEIKPWVLQKFPDNYNDKEILKLVPHFCYPCEIKCTVVQVFSFVLTGADSKWTYGYCRHTPNASTALCILSSLPWHETFYELLNRIAEITHRKEAIDLSEFLEALNNVEVPDPGGDLILTYNKGKNVYTFHCSDHTKLPSIPENRNVTEYFNAVDAQNMMVIFASMLNERRIIVISSKLSRLSACVQSANALIYPMHWQHIFIPVLPYKLVDYISAPMPFLIGVPASVLEKVPKLDLSDIVVLYADQNRVETPFDDFQSLPPEIVSSLKRRLKNSTAMLGDRVARAFLHSLVQLIGGYSDALNYGPGDITFNRDAFIQTRTPSMQPFLQRMLHLQIFQQFIEGRLEMLNSGEGFQDEFETEVNAYADKNSAKLRNQYREWMSSVKKEGGAFLKSVKNKVKDRSKKAYKGVRSKIQELQQKEIAADSIGTTGNTKSSHPRSAPSSPTLLRTRPVTFHGLKFTWDRIPHNIDKPRQYNLLEVNEVNDSESALEPDERIPSQSSSPNLSMRRISMDLMGDLQDIIFRRCSVGESASNEHLASPTSVSQTDESNIATSTQEPLLIQLDAEEEPEEIFDPLLAKPKQKNELPVDNLGIIQQGMAPSQQQHFESRRQFSLQTSQHQQGFQKATNVYPNPTDYLPTTMTTTTVEHDQNKPGFIQTSFAAAPYPMSTQQTPPPPRIVKQAVFSANVPSSNPFQMTGNAASSGFQHPMPIGYSNVTNPFVNYYETHKHPVNGTLSQSMPIVKPQFQNPFQVTTSTPQQKTSTVSSGQTDPFSNLLQWDGNSTVADKSQWETFN